MAKLCVLALTFVASVASIKLEQPGVLKAADPTLRFVQQGAQATETTTTTHSSCAGLSRSDDIEGWKKDMAVPLVCTNYATWKWCHKDDTDCHDDSTCMKWKVADYGGSNLPAADIVTDQKYCPGCLQVMMLAANPYCYLWGPCWGKALPNTLWAGFADEWSTTFSAIFRCAIQFPVEVATGLVDQTRYVFDEVKGASF